MERRSTKVEKIQQWKCVKDGEDGVKESKKAVYYFMECKSKSQKAIARFLDFLRTTLVQRTGRIISVDKFVKFTHFLGKGPRGLCLNNSVTSQQFNYKIYSVILQLTRIIVPSAFKLAEQIFCYGIIYIYLSFSRGSCVFDEILAL